MGLESVRARLKDRQVKAGAFGTDDMTVCLDVGLVRELRELESERADVEAGRPRLGDAAGSSPALERKIAAKQKEVQASSLRLVFRSVASTRYQELLNEHPDANDSEEGRAAFFNALAGASLHQVWEFDESEKQVEGLTWDEIHGDLTYGEWDLATTKVLALNRSVVDVPKSPTTLNGSRSRSAKTRS